MKSASVALNTFLLGIPLTTQNFAVADLFTFTLVDGTVVRVNSFGVDITFGGHTFLGTAFQVNRTKISNRVGLEVSSIDVDIIADPSHQVEAKPVLAQITAGLFDAAFVKVERLFIPALSTGGFDFPTALTMATIVLFAGTVSDISEIGRTHAKITVKSLLELLNVQLPRNLYSPGCRHTLFDAGCTLNPATFTFNGVVGSSPTAITIPSNLTQAGPLAAPTAAPTLTVSTNSTGVNLGQRVYWAVVTYTGAAGESSYSPEASISLNSNQTLNVASPSSASGATGFNVYVSRAPGDEQRQNGGPISIGGAYHESATGIVTGVPPPAIATGGYFAQGTVVFTSGALDGLSRTVRQYFGNGTMVVIPGFPVAPAPGDTFAATAGCDKSLPTCLGKFNNLIHIGSMPWTPTPEQSV